MQSQTNMPLIITPELLSPRLPLRPADSNKSSFGSALIIAGSLYYTGAALLAARACLRTGVGLLRMAVPRFLHPALAGAVPEAIWTPLPSQYGTLCARSALALRPIFTKQSALLIGPGLGNTRTTWRFAKRLFDHTLRHFPTLPCVLDADMLNLLSRDSTLFAHLPRPCVLTPHPGEMARLCHCSVAEVQENRAKLAQKLAQEQNVIVVLKGAFTLIATPEGDLRQLPFANAVLAHAGSGDVLAGITVSLLAQGLNALDAASIAVWLHAQSALLALAEQGDSAAVLPSDLITQLGNAMASLRTSSAH